MLWIYNIGIILYGTLIKIASLFNPKAKLFVIGRKGIWKEIESKIDQNDKPVWFHFASLGEFEQGRPVLEKLKAKNPLEKIIITFFSPSGYEVRKNYALAEVFYLPLDTASNAKKFITLVNPSKAIFTKYEFWFHYFKTLNQNQIPLYLISGIFRPNQIFFKWYGAFYSNMLRYVTHFFVQNDESVSLLRSIDIKQVSLSGDTRFDRVYENAENPKKLEFIEKFCGITNVFIAGSTWLPDEQLIKSVTKKYPDWKFIIAPHEISSTHIEEIKKLYPDALLYSTLNTQVDEANEVNNEPTSKPENPKILIVDNIGMLSSLYQYAKLAYIGGGFGVGIHNTLEAAAFGIPVIFGPKYDKFQEAKDLIAIGTAKSISNEAELLNAFENFKENPQATVIARKYVLEKKGASALIMQKISS